ncbi:hypothetical protein RS3R6_14030 [Pseudomonas atacamensis]|nr:hypothetical protein RS3R6_14030 [Pseudomonas atacamensis]
MVSAWPGWTLIAKTARQIAASDFMARNLRSIDGWWRPGISSWLLIVAGDVVAFVGPGAFLHLDVAQ